MNILFYTPVNFRCRDLESLAKKYIENGHKVYFHSQCAPGPMHDSFSSFGAEVSHESKEASFLKWRQLRTLLKLCRTNRIDLIYSHLEPTNFIAVIGQFLLPAKVVIFRHHVDQAKIFGFDKSIAYRTTYTLAKFIVTVSEAGKQYMINEERVSPGKIRVIPLGYDFDLYEKPDQLAVQTIRQTNSCSVLLVTVGRLELPKRVNLSIDLLQAVVKKGIDARLLILGVGPERKTLEDQCRQYGLSNRVVFGGYVNNTIDYLAAADFLIHPSESESSCVVVKEAAIVELPVIVCRGVGDFDSYLNETNGVVVDAGQFVQQASVHIEAFHRDPTSDQIRAQRLKAFVTEHFSIDRTFPLYRDYEVK